MRIEFSANKESIEKYSTGDIERVANSALRTPDSRFLTFHKPYKNMADSKFTFHRLLSLLRWVKTVATWKTVIEIMQSLGMDKFRVCLLYTSPSPRDQRGSRMPSSA